MEGYLSEEVIQETSRRLQKFYFDQPLVKTNWKEDWAWWAFDRVHDALRVKRFMASIHPYLSDEIV